MRDITPTRYGRFSISPPFSSVKIPSDSWLFHSPASEEAKNTQATGKPAVAPIRDGNSNKNSPKSSRHGGKRSMPPPSGQFYERRPFWRRADSGFALHAGRERRGAAERALMPKTKRLLEASSQTRRCYRYSEFALLRFARWCLSVVLFAKLLCL